MDDLGLAKVKLLKAEKVLNEARVERAKIESLLAKSPPHSLRPALAVRHLKVVQQMQPLEKAFDESFERLGSIVAERRTGMQIKFYRGVYTAKKGSARRA
jgi:hypothetical protein